MPYRWSHVAEPDRHQWVFKRNCALRPWQLAVWFGTVAAVALAIAFTWAVSGAWPVIAFAIAEVVVLAVAFVAYARHAGDFERIVATRERLMVECGSGVRLERVEREGTRIRVEYDAAARGPIRLVAGREEIAVGRFVPDECRDALVRELRGAFGAWSPA